MKKVFSNKYKLLLGAAIFWMAAPNAQGAALKLEDSRSGKPLACVELEKDEFALSFIHSVSLTPVEDLYKIKKITPDNYIIKQVEERFVAHGQGLPSMNAEPDAHRFELRDNKFILHLDRSIETLIVRLDSRFKNRLHTGNQQLDLNQWPDFSGVLFTPTDGCH